MEHVTFDGGLRGVYGVPPGAGPFPGVVVLHEIFGLNDDIERIAGRFVEAGYATVAPDLYSGGSKPLCIARTVRELLTGATTTPQRIDVVRRWLLDQPAVSDRIGVIGFCMGGGFALASAARLEFDAAAVNYGDLVVDVEELAEACPIVASYGREDRRLLPKAARLRAALQRFEIPHDLRVYEDAGHSFMNRSAPRVARRIGVGYVEEAAEDAWRRILDWFDLYLRGPAVQP